MQPVTADPHQPSLADSARRSFAVYSHWAPCPAAAQNLQHNNVA